VILQLRWALSHSGNIPFVNLLDMSAPQASGLDGVVVASTALSDVDGERGRLIFRGYPVEELVERATFEEVCG
jgi:citrate synthase